MANQPTKYRKFIVGAASAALVASAVAPVASAKDFKDTKGNTHEAAIDALSDKGIITGYEDGTFKPNKTLTRQDVVKLMGKWLVSEGYEVPTDYKTNMRFSDLKATTNDELLKYAAVVKDNGVFNGSNGRLLAGDDITRENMAVVLVRAFDTVEDINLVEYVEGQDFKKDVTDRNSAKSEARTAIDVLDFFDITTVTQFNPKATTTRGHFATFLNNFLNADLSKVTGTVSGVASITAVNTTTVEVTFVDKVENVSGFTIAGLEVTNAAVKQSNDKVVVLTTAAQEGGKKYTVSHAGKELGSFEGVSAVVPTKIDITTQSVQGKTGEQAKISADVGVKQAGIPVTFNVKADTNTTLNKDQVFEAVTDENGIATFSYTQYAAGTDEVVAYPTGAPTVRSHAFVFWGVDTILTVAPTDKKGNSVNNGEDKTYKLTYLDPKTGKPVANQKFFVTFEENVNVNVDKASKATVNGENPRQLLNNADPVVAEVTTDAKGEAVFVVSGSNTAVTPIVFIDNGSKDTAKNAREKYEASKLQTKAEKVTFAAIQSEYSIDIERDGLEEAAVGVNNGRDYKITVKTKDGKVAANEIVNVAFNEDLDRNINTVTNAEFIDSNSNGDLYFVKDRVIQVKTNSKGEAEFTIGSDDPKDYATPIAWIDVNSPDAKDGNLDEGETSKIASISYFAEAKLTSGAVEARDAEGKKVPRTGKATFSGNEAATFAFVAANQSGKEMKNLPPGYDAVDATFTVSNNGDNNVLVRETTRTGSIKETTVAPNRNYTTNTITGSKQPSIEVISIGDKNASVKVSASGTAVPYATDKRPINLGSHSAEAKFESSKNVGTEYFGIVSKFDKDRKEITFAGKNRVSYKDKTVSFLDERAAGSKTLTENEFAKQLQATTDAGKLAEVRLLINGDNYKFILVKDSAVKGTEVNISAAQALDVNNDGVADTVELTFSKAIDADVLKSANFTFAGGTVKAQKVEAVSTTKVNITISGVNGLAVPVLEFGAVPYLAADYGDLKAGTFIVTAASESSLLVAARSAVASAETLKTLDSVTTAQSLIDALPASSEKTTLQNRLNVIKAEVLEGAAKLQAAQAAVKAAEQAETLAAYNAALDLVNALPANSDKTTLLSKLAAVKTQIDAQIDVNAEAAKIADAFTANGAAGDVKLPTVATGYTIKVKTTSDATKYDLDGEIVAAGSSNVVYTVTHTATGKTADTAAVTVTVTVTP